MGRRIHRRRVASLGTVIALCLATVVALAGPAAADHGDYHVVQTTYQFEDISTTGTLLSAIECDDCATEVALPFSFDFYGTVYNSIFVSSNGYVTFGAGSGDYTPSPIPSGGNNPTPLIAGHYQDLCPRCGVGAVYYASDDQHAIVQFEDVTMCCSEGYPHQTFQIVLFAGTNTIGVNYESINDSYATPLAGVENGTQGVQFYFDTASTLSFAETSVCYSASENACGGFVTPQRSGRTIDCEPNEGTNRVGDEHLVTCTVRDSAGQVLQYESVTFSSSGVGKLEGSETAETDFQGQVNVTATSTESGTQSITATISDDLSGDEPTQVDECDQAAGSPSGSPAGQCSETVTKTWTQDAPPPPPPGEDKTADTELFMDYVRGSFVGEVISSVDTCEAGRRIVLKKVRRGPDRRVGRTTSDAQGQWSIGKPNARGRYYSVAPAATHTQDDGGTLTCTRAVSHREST